MKKTAPSSPVEPPQPPAPKLVKKWFDDTLGSNASYRPDLAACEKLSWKIHWILHPERFPKTPTEIKLELAARIRQAFGTVLFAVDQFEEFSGTTEVIMGPSEDVTCDEIRTLAARLGVLVGRDPNTPEVSASTRHHFQAAVEQVRELDDSINYSDVIDELARKGFFRREETDHGIRYLGIDEFISSEEPRRAWSPQMWQQVAELIKETLRSHGYTGALSEKKPETVTAVVSAKALSWKLGKEISPEGFVTGLRDRRRKASVQSAR